ncbi:lysine-rich arabinogalactan protein 18-like [Triticum dicoccoides]|uniref:lysine-rich arabinogalactan protein 18-like n=1 Tax=Triticum dicoccoides TaxID=85692 RepID=UPI00188E2C31|nr:lysine-rich arabinogalactan protein 18-like [Triticum dicoccoides]
MMRPSQTNKSQPMPLPLPPPPLSLPSTPSTVPRWRNRSASSSSSSSSVSTASSSSPSTSPAPSPRTTSATSVVPFSWERRPGLPKSNLAGLISSSSDTAAVPLPPPPLRPSTRRCRQRRRRRALDAPAPAPAADPFAAAFVECTREEGTDDGDDKLWLTPTTTNSSRMARPWRLAGGSVRVIRFLDLYGCRRAMDVADGAFLARRSVAPRPRP